MNRVEHAVEIEIVALEHSAQREVAACAIVAPIDRSPRGIGNTSGSVNLFVTNVAGKSPRTCLIQNIGSPVEQFRLSRDVRSSREAPGRPMQGPRFICDRDPADAVSIGLQSAGSGTGGVMAFRRPRKSVGVSGPACPDACDGARTGKYFGRALRHSSTAVGSSRASIEDATILASILNRSILANDNRPVREGWGQAIHGAYRFYSPQCVC